jgi:hypothetical protein
MSEGQRLTVLVRIPKPETQYTWGWIVWTGVSLGGFAVLEGIALRKGEHGNTLSCHLRRTFGIYPRKRWHPVGRAAFLGGLLWLGHHIAFAPGDDPRLRGHGIVLTSEATEG